jgi:thioesterase domain-containing protein
MTSYDDPLFWVHGAGGNVLSMRPLAMALPAELPVYCFQAKGLDGSEPFPSVEETAQCYVDEIRKVQPHGPYYLGGGCYGGVVAFEMARTLAEHGEAVGALFLLDSYNPAFGRFLSKPELLYRNVLFLARCVIAHARKMARLRPREWAGYFEARLKTASRRVWALVKVLTGASASQVPSDFAMAGLEASAGTRIGEILKRVMTANLVASSRFVPKPYAGGATIFRAKVRMVEPYQDDYLGWGPVIRGGFEVFDIDGDHATMAEVPSVSQIAEKIDAKLRQATPAREPARGEKVSR